MQGIIINLIYRLFTFKALVFVGIMVVFNVVLNGYYMNVSEARINVLSDATLHAHTYFYESLFFLKITMMLMIMVFSYLLFSDKRLDIVMIMRRKREVIYCFKNIIIVVITAIIISFCMVNMLFIYSMTDYYDGLDISILVYAQWGVIIIYYTTLNTLVMTYRPSLYAGICVLLAFLMSEILLGFNKMPTTLNGLLQAYTMFFPSIQPYQGHLVFSVYWVFVMVLIVVYTSIGLMIQRHIEY